MLDNWRARLQRVATVADGVSFAVRVMRSTGLLGALRGAGVVRFVRASRGMKAGPHMSVMLHAKNKPDKLAVVHGERRASYAAFDRGVNQIAAAMSAAGVASGARVAIMLPNGYDCLAVQQAIVRVGATAVQLGYRLKAPEIAYILANAEPRTIFVQAEFQDTMAEARRLHAASADATVFVCGAATAAEARLGRRIEDASAGFDGARPPAAAVGSEGGGVIVYTSGTTGKPKGASRDYRKTGLDAVADFMTKMGMHHDDRHLVVCPLYHSAAPAFAAMMMSLGASVFISDHFEPESALAMIAAERITSAFLVPTMIIRLTELPAEVRARYDTSSLRWICSGAAPLATDTARRFQAQYGEILYNFYGATETGLVTLAGPRDHTARPGTVGRLLRSNEARILGEDGREVAAGEVGELYIRNAMLISGYHRNSEATDQSMRDGFFSVGDLARMDADGFIYLESRKHDMVISGGVNIYPREIEDHLHTHADIAEAAVVGVPHPEWGESLKAFVVTRPGASLSEAEVIQFCRDSLADYKRPRAVVFLDELPHNPTGKVLKRELRALGEPDAAGRTGGGHSTNGAGEPS